MIIFINSSGTVTNSVPEQVYQGASNANEIYVVAPFVQNMTATIAFRLKSSGIITQPQNLTYQGELSGVTGSDGGKLYGWSCSINSNVTAYYGTVLAQITFYSAGRTVATSAFSFVVGRGVVAELPADPTEDIYDEILQNISALQSDLNNGYYAARAVYAWNDTYTYGANELVYYPTGQYGVYVKSTAENNTTKPYINGVISAGWELVIDFNVIMNVLSDISASVEAAAQSATNAANSATQAAESKLNASNSANSAASSATAAENSSQAAASSASDAAASADRAAEIVEGLGNTYLPQGSIDFADLPAEPTAAQRGYVWNINDSFTTDSRFVEGAGKQFGAGSNVAVVLNDGVYKYDVLGAFVDLSNYAQINGTYANLTAGGVVDGSIDNTMLSAAVQEAYANSDNIVLNGNFKINQRGQASYTGNGIYTVDGWTCSNLSGGSTTVYYNANGSVRVVSGNAESYFYQYFDLNTFAFGIDYVLAVAVNGIRQTATGTINNTNSAYLLLTFGNNVQCRILKTASTIEVGFVIPQNLDITINNVYFNKGTIAPLYKDPEPTLELLRCLRYGEQITNTNALYNGYGLTNTTVRFAIITSVPMRTVPTINLDVSKIQVFNNTGQVVTPTAYEIQGKANNQIIVSLTIPETTGILGTAIAVRLLQAFYIDANL